MSTGKPQQATTGPASAVVPLSPNFCADDADVIIRAAGTLDFRVHKCIISFVSPVFKDMFTLPQPPSDNPTPLPCVDVQDSPTAWDNILRTIYPVIPNPTIATLDDLESLLSAAHAYDMQSVMEVHKKAFETQTFIVEDPLRLYAIACTYGFSKQATYVARNAEFAKVTGRADPGNLKGLTLGDYGRLVSFLVERDSEWHKTLAAGGRLDLSGCCKGPMELVYEEIKENLRQPYLHADEIYLKALVRRSHQAGGCPSARCSSLASNIKGYVEKAIGVREEMYSELQLAKGFT